MAELIAIITTADVQATLSDQAYKRLYAKSGGATVDNAFLAARVAEANSIARMILRAAYPDGLYLDTDTPDPGVVGAIVDICNGRAAARHPNANEMGGYFVSEKLARELLKSMNRDSDARAPGSSAGRPRPRSAITGTTAADGTPTNPYVRAADQQGGSGF